MPRLVPRKWTGEGFGSRRDRRPFVYQAYVPDPIAELDPELPGSASDAVASAHARVAALDVGAGRAHLETLAGPLLRAEALGSSFIEGYRASHKRVAVAAYDEAVADGTARIVLGNVRAMERAIDIGTSSEPLALDHVLDIHRSLLRDTPESRHAGVLRTEQNWIGGRATSPYGAAFIPPPPEEVQRLMEDLVEFCNREDLPAVVQAAIAHAQYETIHPHADGNGRAGRCLVHVILRRRRIATHYVPPVSVVLATNARTYIGGLTDYREGRMAEWVGVFASAVAAAADAAEQLALRIARLKQVLLDAAGRPRADSVARRIIEGVAEHPIVSAETAAKIHGVTPTSARRALNLLTERGVLRLTRIGRRRDREWACDPLFDLLDAFEFELATPIDEGVPRRPAPTRHRRRHTESRSRSRSLSS